MKAGNLIDIDNRKWAGNTFEWIFIQIVVFFGNSFALLALICKSRITNVLDMNQ